MAIKRSKEDAVFSLLVRERAGNVCEHTGQTGEVVGLECAHIWGRRNRSVRWHPLNAVSLCHYSHRYFTENPAAFIAWIKSRIGEQAYDELERLARQPRKFSPREMEGLYQHMLHEYARLRSARENGREGRLEFFWPDPILEVEPRKKAKKASAKKPSKPLTNPNFKRKVNGQTVVRAA